MENYLTSRRDLMTDYVSPLIDLNSKGAPLATIENLAEICKRSNIMLRYNVISKEHEIIVDGSTYSVDNNTNASIAFLQSECAKFKFPIGNLMSYITALSDANQYNPVLDWINSKPWDGVDRLGPLTESLGSKNPELTAVLLRKWMVGAIEAALSPWGVDNSSVLVLQGEQGAGKTSWLKALLPTEVEHLMREGAMLNTSDKDSVLGVIQYWIVELGELDATFKKSDVAALKAFITKPRDEIRKPYAQAASKYPRRTVFCASVNPLHFLHDDKNRRFWTVECTNMINPKHGIDMQQAWAQAKIIHESGETWLLSQDELSSLNDHNERYKAPDPITELILQSFDPDAPAKYRRMSASQVLHAVGYKNIGTKETRVAAQVLREYFGESTGKVNGVSVYEMPEKKEGS